MTPIFAIDTRGSARLTICIGPWALKVARNATGRRCNYLTREAAMAAFAKSWRRE
jgi:hypothetical protein